MKLFFAPHNDDETLFGAFTLLREKPLVIVCLRSVNQERAYGITHERRELEPAEAMAHLECDWRQWEYPNDAPDRNAVRDHMQAISYGVEHVWAPCPDEIDAHQQHRMIGALALEVFGEDRVTQYLTYSEKPPYRRTEGLLVSVENPFWVKQKLLALAAYQSQIIAPDGYHHFLNDQREFYRG